MKHLIFLLSLNLISPIHTLADSICTNIDFQAAVKKSYHLKSDYERILKLADHGRSTQAYCAAVDKELSQPGLYEIAHINYPMRVKYNAFWDSIYYPVYYASGDCREWSGTTTYPKYGQIIDSDNIFKQINKLNANTKFMMDHECGRQTPSIPLEN